MELAGLKLCLSEVLDSWKLKVENYISDRHIQIRAYMRDTYGSNRKEPASKPYIKHYLDVGHVAKSNSYTASNLGFSFSVFTFTFVVWR